MIRGVSSAPLLNDHHVWSSLVDAARPASILVAIASRLGDLSGRLAPEDVWQETLLRAWRARADHKWQGVAAFRQWLVRIAENCLEDARAYEHAHKRDLTRTVSWQLPARDQSGDTRALEPWGSTTPSRVAIERERARAMEAALASLPEDVREVVRLRLFEDLPLVEIAARLEIGESGVRHRFRRGTELFAGRLRALLRESTSPVRPPPELRDVAPGAV